VPPCLLQCPSCELTAIAETIPSQQWATDRSALLWEANAQVNADRAQGLAMLPAGAVERLQDRYDAILTAAEATNPRPSPASPAPAGRVKPPGASGDPPPTTSSTACGNTAMRSCASSPICASPSTIIRPNATSVCPTQAEGFRLFPLRDQGRRLRRDPLLPLNAAQTIRQSFSVSRPDIPEEPSDASHGIAE